MYRVQIGNKIRKVRIEKGFSQEELSEASGLSRRFLVQIESGEANASCEKLFTLAKTLQVSVVSFFAEIDDVEDRFSFLLKTVYGMSETKCSQMLDQMLHASKRFSLVGLRGAGKSTVGQKVAEKLQIEFVQTDELLQNYLQLPLDDIFQLYGPKKYRELSRTVLDDLQKRPSSAPYILEVGGSLILDPICYAWLQQHSTQIWLKASAESHMARVEAQGDKRVLSPHHDHKEVITQLMKERFPFYAQSHHIFETDTLGIEQTVEQVSAVIRSSIVQKIDTMCVTPWN